MHPTSARFKLSLQLLILALCCGTFGCPVAQPPEQPANEPPARPAPLLVLVDYETPTSITLEATDPDSGPEALRYEIATLPAHGSLSEPDETPIDNVPYLLPEDVNQVIYEPYADYHGSDEFTFRAYDGEDWSEETGTVSITVNPGDDGDDPTPLPDLPPVADAGPDQSLTDSNDDGSESVTLDGSGSSDADGTIVNYRWSEGSTVLYDGPNATTGVVLTVATHEITLTVTDDDDATDSDQLTITINPHENQPPVAYGQTVTVEHETPTPITLLAEDPDGGPEPLTYHIVTSSAHGTLSGDPPTVIYTPATGYEGSDQFVFRAFDGEDYSNDATVSITVNPNRALLFLRSQHDQYHSEWFDVYTDVASAGNHFACSAMMLSGGLTVDELSVDDACTDQPHSGGTCIRYGFLGRGTDWGGFYRMNGVLRGDDIEPQPNWGTDPNAGLDLTGALELEFWARGGQAGQEIEFFVFGVGRDPDTGDPIEPYPDSSPKRSISYITLSTEWERHVISLGGADLSYVLGGFGWVTNAWHSGNEDAVFYLDDIRYRLARPETLRLLQSYVPRDTDLGSATLLRNLATTYDNALAVIAFVAKGDLDTAQLLADALVYALEHDRWFDDGRLRNGYQAGDLMLPPGWEPHGRPATARIPGWWGSEGSEEPSWHEDAGFVGSKVGDSAWAIIALLEYRNAVGMSGSDEYLEAAVALGEWIESNCRSSIGAGGYTGGFEGWEPNQDQVTWKSTEHNLDVYAAFTRLYQATTDETWLQRAEAARTFVEAMWNEADGHFWTGTTDDGITINETVIPLDVQAWAVLAFEGESPYEQALDWAEAHCALEHEGYHGFDFNTDLDGIWFEGTAHMALAYSIVDVDDQAAFYLEQLHLAQSSDLYGDGLGLVATSKEDLTTGFGTTFARRLHVGATCWLIFAEANYNPYWGTR